MMKGAQGNKEQKRVKNVAFELYEDSCSVIWEQTLEGLHVRCFWIYHDKDVREDGSLKKPHYHVMLMYGNQVRVGQVERLVALLGAANNHYEVVQSVPGYARYLCHLDDPDKYQYPIESVHELGMANYQDVIGRTKEDKLKVLEEILDFCDSEGVEWYGALVKHCRKNGSEEGIEKMIEIE